MFCFASVRRRAITLRTLLSLTSSCGAPPSAGDTDGVGAGAGAGAEAAAAGAAPGLASSTSALTIRPLGPLPVMVERSIPFCSANRFASGDAMMRSPDAAGAAAGAGAGLGAGAGALVPLAASTSSLVILPFGPVPVIVLRSIPLASASLRAVGVAAGPSFDGGAAGAGAGVGAAAAASASASSPSSASTAITVPTETFSVPSSTAIETSVPSSTASNSIVALSVSISAMISPDRISSPGFTSHLASVPSSIVGDSAGILISIGIAGEIPFPLRKGSLCRIRAHGARTLLRIRFQPIPQTQRTERVTCGYFWSL